MLTSHGRPDRACGGRCAQDSRIARDVVKELDADARWFADKGRRQERATVAGGVDALQLVEVAFTDGPAQRYLAIADDLAWAPLLRALAEGPLPGDGGRFVLDLPGGAASLPPADAGQRVPSTDQSNTLVALDERLLVKAYRRLEAGPHPELDLLAGLGPDEAPVPRYVGALRWHAADGTRTAVALLQELVTGAEGGWTAPIAEAADDLATGRTAAVARWRDAGSALGGLHRALCARRPLAVLRPDDPARWSREAARAFAAASEGDEAVAALRAPVAAGLDRLARRRDVPVTRVHGDMHIAQTLRAGARTWIVDFEGDPLRPLADRLEGDHPLRDLAGLRRSAAHVAIAAARRAGDASPRGWIAVVQRAVDDGYRATSPVAVDAGLVHDLELAKACTELLYAKRVAPEWAYAPRAGLRQLLGRA